jgi:hypothetical protein
MSAGDARVSARSTGPRAATATGRQRRISAMSNGELAQSTSRLAIIPSAAVNAVNAAISARTASMPSGWTEPASTHKGHAARRPDRSRAMRR